MNWIEHRNLFFVLILNCLLFSLGKNNQISLKEKRLSVFTIENSMDEDYNLTLYKNRNLNKMRQLVSTNSLSFVTSYSYSDSINYGRLHVLQDGSTIVYIHITGFLLANNYSIYASDSLQTTFPVITSNSIISASSYNNIVTCNSLYIGNNQILTFLSSSSSSDLNKMMIFQYSGGVFTQKNSITNFFSPITDSAIVSDSVILPIGNTSYYGALVQIYQDPIFLLSILLPSKFISLNIYRIDSSSLTKYYFTLNPTTTYPIDYSMTKILGVISSSTMMFIITLKNDNKTICFWFMDYSLSQGSTLNTPQFTYLHSNTITSLIYKYDTNSGNIFIVFLESVGGINNLVYRAFSFVNVSNLNLSFSGVLISNISQVTLNYMNLIDSFLIISSNSWIETIAIDLTSGSTIEWIKANYSMNVQDILPIFPNGDSEIVLYFYMTDSQTNVSRLSTNSCLFYKSNENGSTKCRTSCLSYQNTWQGQCITCSQTNPYFYNGSCLSQCPNGLVTNTCNNNCLSSCPAGCNLLDSSNKCNNACPNSSPYIYGNTCVNSCPNGGYISTNNQCESSCNTNEYWYLDSNNNKICTSQCPQGYSNYSISNQCLSSCGSLYVYNTSCIVQCPTGTYINGLICVNSCPDGEQPDINNVCQVITGEAAPATTELSSPSTNDSNNNNSPSTTQVNNSPSTTQVNNSPSTTQVNNSPSTTQGNNSPSTTQGSNSPSTQGNTNPLLNATSASTTLI